MMYTIFMLTLHQLFSFLKHILIQLFTGIDNTISVYSSHQYWHATYSLLFNQLHYALTSRRWYAKIVSIYNKVINLSFITVNFNFYILLFIVSESCFRNIFIEILHFSNYFILLKISLSKFLPNCIKK